MIVCDMCLSTISSEDRVSHFFQVVRLKDPISVPDPYAKTPLNSIPEGSVEYADICSKECADRFAAGEPTLEAVVSNKDA